MTSTVIDTVVPVAENGVTSTQTETVSPSSSANDVVTKLNSGAVDRKYRSFTAVVIIFYSSVFFYYVPRFNAA